MFVTGPMRLRAFQNRFLSAALAPGIDTACLSLPRGNGKSRLAAYIGTRAMTPGDTLFHPGTESVLCAASLEQCRAVFGFIREALEPLGGYRFSDSGTRISVVHLVTNTRLRALGSNGRTAMGLVRVPLVIADEPGAWETAGGRLLHDAIQGAQGKPESPLRAIYIGTLAPAESGWWHELIDGGSEASTYVMALRGDRKRWDQWAEIRRCNPLMSSFADSRRKLLEERDAARRDSRSKARFLSYRLNAPTADEATTILTVQDWERACLRAVPERRGRPVVGTDLGGGRAWSAAVAIWQTGRIEALAVAPGIPSIEGQEKRDRQPAGVYGRLLEGGALRVAEGRRVQPPADLWQAIRAAWGVPARVVCDRFRLPDLQDAIGTACPIEPRVSRWSEASADVRALRKGVMDGPFAVHERSQDLLTVSLAAARVKNDEQGNFRLLKKDPLHNTGRDDVAAALVLAAGAWERASRQPVRRWRSHGVIAA